MALKFDCPKCGSAIYVNFVGPGEMAECRSCGAKAPVPDGAAEAEPPPGYLVKASPAPAKTASTAKPKAARYECPRCKTLCGEGTEVCPTCNLRFSTISLYSPKHFVWLSLFMSFLVPAYIASANWGRLGHEGKRRAWLIGGMAGLVATIVFFFMLEEILGIGAEKSGLATGSLGRLFAFGVNLPLGYILREQQKPLFRRGLKLGMKPAPLCKGVFKGLGLVAVALVIGVAVVIIVSGNPVDEAYGLLEQERYGEAAAAFDSLLVDDPGDTDFLWNSAVCHAGCGEYAAAGASMEAYIALKPDDAAGYAVLGRIRLEQGLVSEGRRLISLADSMQPGVLEELTE